MIIFNDTNLEVIKSEKLSNNSNAWPDSGARREFIVHDTEGKTIYCYFKNKPKGILNLRWCDRCYIEHKGEKLLVNKAMSLEQKVEF